MSKRKTRAITQSEKSMSEWGTERQSTFSIIKQHVEVEFTSVSELALLRTEGEGEIDEAAVDADDEADVEEELIMSQTS